MHPGPPRKENCASARWPQVQRRHSGLPCAVGYGLLRALPGELCFDCHRRHRRAFRAPR